MISSEQGVYLQFFDEGEPADRELPPLGPFELLIIRHNRIIGDRENIEHDVLGAGSVERWLEAELELRRALGDEPGGVRRSHMRIRAPRGDIIVRFYDYAGDEAPKVPELGPFYALVVAKREVRADDKLIALRSTDMSPWTLTDAIRPGIAGINKADFSVFSLSVREPRSAPRPTAPPPIAVQQVAPSPAVASFAAPAREPVAPPPVADSGPAPADREFVERRKIQREVYVARPLPTQDEQLTPADVNLILRVDKLKQQELAQQLMVERLRREQHVDPEIALRTAAVDELPMRFQPPVKERTAAEIESEEYEDEPFTGRILGLLWRARLVIITLLILVAGVSAYGYIRTSAPSGPPPLTFASVGTKIGTPDWTIAVDSVERTFTLGTTRPVAGSLLLVHITATKKNGDAPNLDPANFALVDAAGAHISAFGTTSDVYRSTAGLTWPVRYAVSAPTRSVLVFDVNPGAKGLLLLITGPNVEVRIPDP
jgi:hypothetical protein